MGLGQSTACAIHALEQLSRVGEGQRSLLHQVNTSTRYVPETPNPESHC